MVSYLVAEGLANTHWHGREPDATTMGPLILNAIAGGADVLGPQPNTNDGLTEVKPVMDYAALAQSLVPEGYHMDIIPFVMLTEKTTNNDLDLCAKRGVKNAKGYPYKRTTLSDNGIEHHARIIPQVKHCGEIGINYHQHPEHASMLYGNRIAEFAFLPVARMYLEEAPNTIIIWEHGTDGDCIPHWEDMATSGRFFVTITAHHLASNEDDMYGDVRGICKPPFRPEPSRQGLIRLIEKDYSWVMAGLDDAFHDKSKKHVDVGRAACGAYTAPFGLPLYAHTLEHLFETDRGIKTFLNFTSRNTRRFHGLGGSCRTIRLIRTPQVIPLTYPIGPETALPFWAGQTINWQIADSQ